MVGEGVMMECLDHPEVEQVLIVNRRPYGYPHPKLKELIVSDFMNLAPVTSQLAGYDACFFCAGISSVGLKEEAYRKITYDLTLHFANTLVNINPGMVFTYVSGAQTDSTEKGNMMWARVKGKTENDLMKLPFRKVYNFRPGVMKPSEGQKSIKTLYKLIGILFPLFKMLMPGQVLTLHTVGLAMIKSVSGEFKKSVLEIADIKALAAS